MSSRSGNRALPGKWWVPLVAFLAVLQVSEVFGDWQVTDYAGTDEDACVAWNGNHYLIAWTRNRNDTTFVYGHRVTSSREFAGGLIPIWDPVLSSATNGARYPRVSGSGGGGSKWLVVWRNEYSDVMEILGRIVDSDGTPDANVLTVGTTDYFNPVPVVAWNGSKWLVVWEGYQSYRYIEGRFIYTDGTMGPVFNIDMEADVQKYRARVGALGSDFFVAWTDNRDGVYNIYGKRVDTAGIPGPRLQVHACDAGDYTNTVTGGSICFLVTWRCLGTGGDAHIWGQRVNAAGTATVGSKVEISSDQINNSGGAAWTGSYFKVAYDLTSQGPYCRPVYEDGSVGSETDLSELLSSGAGSYLATAQGDTNCLCVWDANIGNRDIYADGTGVPTGIEPDFVSPASRGLSIAPNPLTPGHAVVGFRIEARSTVCIDVFNTAGQRVAAVVNEELESGAHAIDWNAQGLRAGVYFVRLVTEDGPSVTRKVVCLR